MKSFLKVVLGGGKLKHWACLKSFIFGVCFSGFAYQGMEFVRHYWTYPTILDYTLEKNRTFIEPAVTFCNANSIQRSKFCAGYPEKCEFQSRNSELCASYPLYCEGKDNHSLVPKIEIFSNTYPQVDELRKFEQSYDTFLRFATGHSDIQGPYIYKDNGLRQNILCYSVNSRVDDDVDPAKRTLEQEAKGDIPYYRFDFAVFPRETFYPWTKPGVFFHIHSPFEARVPSREGILLKPGTEVRIRMRLEEEHLLPYPYQTDCINYTHVWESRNRTGPRSADMCEKRCELKFLQLRHGCNNLFVEYPVLLKGKKGNAEWCDLTEQEKNSTKQCKSKCKDQCLKLKYSYSVTEVNMNPFVNANQNRNMIKVFVSLENPEILVLRHKPKYQDVELFSTVGGFLGIWLGISLFSFADIVKSTWIYMISKFKDSKELSSLLEI